MVTHIFSTWRCHKGAILGIRLSQKLGLRKYSTLEKLRGISHLDTCLSVYPSAAAAAHTSSPHQPMAARHVLGAGVASTPTPIRSALKELTAEEKKALKRRANVASNKYSGREKALHISTGAS